MEESAFWRDAHFPRHSDSGSDHYIELDSNAGKVRLLAVATGDEFDAPQEVWESYQWSDKDGGNGPDDRKPLYDLHLASRHGWKESLPRAGAYKEVMERGKAVLLIRQDDGAGFWCPTSVWEGWLAGDKKAAKWFLDNAQETKYRPRWGTGGARLTAVAGEDE